MFSHHVQLRYVAAGGEVAADKVLDYTSDGNVEFDGSFADGTDYAANEMDIAFKAANVKSFLLLSDQNVTVRTNTASPGTDSFTLTANVPFIWAVTDFHTAVPFSADVTKMFLHNGSGFTANFKVRVLAKVTL